MTQPVERYATMPLPFRYSPPANSGTEQFCNLISFTAEVLPPRFFFLEQRSISLHSYPSGGMSEVILNLVPKKIKYKGVR
jgi:hypothetical protein